MSDRYASRNKGQYGYSGYSNNRSYNKDSSSRGGYGRPSPLSSSLSAPPRKKASVRPAPLPSLKSENADAVNILSSSGWGQKKSEDKASKRGKQTFVLITKIKKFKEKMLQSTGFFPGLAGVVYQA